MVFYEVPDLRRNLGTIPSHNQHLADCPNSSKQVTRQLATMTMLTAYMNRTGPGSACHPPRWRSLDH